MFFKISLHQEWNNNFHLCLGWNEELIFILIFFFINNWSLTIWILTSINYFTCWLIRLGIWCFYFFLIFVISSSDIVSFLECSPPIICQIFIWIPLLYFICFLSMFIADEHHLVVISFAFLRFDGPVWFVILWFIYGH